VNEDDGLWPVVPSEVVADTLADRKNRQVLLTRVVLF
jgi:hypothetical protein